MNVLITGSKGFIGKNLIIRLKEMGIPYSEFDRSSTIQDLNNLIKKSQFIVHLAGENRPINEKDFDTVNRGLTNSICDAVRDSGKNIPILYTSSTQAELDNPYGKSKLQGELVVQDLGNHSENNIYIYRLPGVFGKWSKPNYNSVVSTFCHNLNHKLPITINDPSVELNLVYIDDVIDEFVRVIQGNLTDNHDCSVNPVYKIKLGQLADQLKVFSESRNSLVTEKVGTGLIRKLHSTYLSYVPPENFSYKIPSHGDERGMFAEVLKTKDSGQFSFFTAKPGITRGGHYHHSKTEKFLVIQGKARFCFKNMSSFETYEIYTDSQELEIVETVPGWAHDITNIGEEEMVVMLWANEIFDQEKPDTFSSPL